MVDKVINKIINEDDDFQREYSKFIKAAVDGAKMCTKNRAKLQEAKENAEKNILKRMGNRMLDSMKELKKRDTLVKKDTAYKKQLAINITSDLFQIFASLNKEHQRHGELKNAELSK